MQVIASRVRLADVGRNGSDDIRDPLQIVQQMQQLGPLVSSPAILRRFSSRSTTDTAVVGMIRTVVQSSIYSMRGTCMEKIMARLQILLDESIADRLRIICKRQGVSRSRLVSQALAFYFDHQMPDTSWIGSLHPQKRVSHALHEIRASVVEARQREE
jgi:hypothetical protein